MAFCKVDGFGFFGIGNAIGAVLRGCLRGRLDEKGPGTSAGTPATRLLPKSFSAGAKGLMDTSMRK